MPKINPKSQFFHYRSTEHITTNIENRKRSSFIAIVTTYYFRHIDIFEKAKYNFSIVKNDQNGFFNTCNEECIGVCRG